MRPIWRKDEVDESKDYVLLLLENEEGEREYELREFEKRYEKTDGAKCCFVTKKIPIDLVVSRNLMEIADVVGIEGEGGGGGFLFDSNGIWHTLKEFEEFKRNFK